MPREAARANAGAPAHHGGAGRWRVPAMLAASGALHLALVAGLATTQGGGPRVDPDAPWTLVMPDEGAEPAPAQRDDPRRPPDPPVPDETRAVLGTPESPESPSRAWIGAAEPTPHNAPKGPTDQGGFTRAAGSSGDDSPGASEAAATGPFALDGSPTTTDAAAPEAPMPPVATPAPSPETARADASAPSAAPTPAEEEHHARPEPQGDDMEPPATTLRRSKPDEAMGDDASMPPRDASTPTREPFEPERSRVDGDRSVLEQERPQEPASRPSAGAAGGVAAPAGPGKGRPGEAGVFSDRESDATSKDPLVNVDFRLGKPLTARGLEIKTVRPELTVTTRNFTPARNPRVRVVFGRDGTVKHAAYVRGHDTGSREWDVAVRDAIYRWTARGEELKKIPPNAPDAGVAVTFRIMLRDM